MSTSAPKVTRAEKHSPRYGQPEQRKASPREQLPQELSVGFILLAAAAAPLSRSFSSSSGESEVAAPFLRISSISSSARPHVQPLQAFFLRTAPAWSAARSIGSHFVAGGSRSSGVRSDVGSMDCAAGAVIVHRAFFFAEASRRGRGSATLAGASGATSMGLVPSVSGRTATVSWGVDGPEESEDVAFAAGER